VEFIELRRLLQDAEADHVIEVGRLVTLVRNVCRVLVDPGMPTIPKIPQDPCTASNILAVVDVILECLKEAYEFGHGPWD
jgi:hypothetical protein